MLRFQTSLSSSSSRRNTRTCSSIPASWAPTEARSKAGRQPLRCAAPGFVRQRPWLHSAAAAVAAAKSGRLYDSDDYEWHEFDEQLGLAKTSEVPAASAAGAGGAGASVSSSSCNGSAAGYESYTNDSVDSSQHSKQRQRRHQAPAAEDDPAGGGIVGVFVAGWMALLALLLRLLQPVVSLVLMMVQPLTHMSPARAKHQMQKLAAELPEGFWAKLHFLWELPIVKSIRITLSVANWGVRLPAIAALLLTQGSILASQVSLPMLAPLLLGTGMMMNSIKKNASYIFPRVGLLFVLLWLLWFVNSVIQNTWLVLRNQGRIDARTMSGARMITECSSLLLAGILVLSALGININALLLPTGVVLAIASKDLLQNLIAGFYLVLVQPFRLGDKVAVSCSLPSSQTAAAGGSRASSNGLSAAAGAASSSGSSGGALLAVQGWFEGVCEKVDLRYTVLRDGRRRLMVPNTAFVSREFLVYDDVLADTSRHSSPSSSTASSRSSSPWPGSSTPDQGGAAGVGLFGGLSAQEPVLKEGHMATELPPLAPPIFPGMTLMPPPGYPQYAAQHYAAVPYAHYGQMQQEQQQQQQEEDEQQQAPDERSQQQDGHNGSAAPVSAAPDGSDRQPVQQQQQQQGSKQQAARGPPGYLPQGYRVGQYVGIPVYWTLPGMLGPWSGSSTADSKQQHQHQHQQQQQQQQQQLQQQQQQQQLQQQIMQQQYYDFYEPVGMHQPLPTHYQAQTPPPLQQQQHQQQQHRQQQHAAGQQHNAQDPWTQQEFKHNHHQQQQQGRAGQLSSSGGTVGRSNKVQPRASGSQGSGRSSNIHQAIAQQQAVHVAAMGGGCYSYLGAAPPEALHEHLQYQQYAVQHMPNQAVQSFAQPAHHMSLLQQRHYQDLSHAAAAGSMPAEYSRPLSMNDHQWQQQQQQQQQQHSGTASSEGAASGGSSNSAAEAGTPSLLRASSSPVDLAGAAASADLAAGVLPLPNGVTAAASAAAVAGTAARHLHAEHFASLAQQADQILKPIAGVCRELGQELSDL